MKKTQSTRRSKEVTPKLKAIPGSGNSPDQKTIDRIILEAEAYNKRLKAVQARHENYDPVLNYADQAHRLSEFLNGFDDIPVAWDFANKVHLVEMAFTALICVTGKYGKVPDNIIESKDQIKDLIMHIGFNKDFIISRRDQEDINLQEVEKVAHAR